MSVHGTSDADDAMDVEAKSPFIQIPAHMLDMVEDGDLQPIDLAIYASLQQLAHSTRKDDGKKIRPGRRWIAGRVGVKSLTTISESMKRLCSAGQIQVSERRREDGGRGSNYVRVWHSPFGDEDWFEAHPRRPGGRGGRQDGRGPDQQTGRQGVDVDLAVGNTAAPATQSPPLAPVLPFTAGSGLAATDPKVNGDAPYGDAPSSPPPDCAGPPSRARKRTPKPPGPNAAAAAEVTKVWYDAANAKFGRDPLSPFTGVRKIAEKMLDLGEPRDAVQAGLLHIVGRNISKVTAETLEQNMAYAAEAKAKAEPRPYWQTDHVAREYWQTASA